MRAILDVKEETLHSASASAIDGKILDVDGYSAVLCQVSGTFSGTITWKASADKTNFISVLGYNLNNAADATTATATGLYLIPVPGCIQFMADITTYASGSITVIARAISDATGLTIINA